MRKTEKQLTYIKITLAGASERAAGCFHNFWGTGPVRSQHLLVEVIRIRSFLPCTKFEQNLKTFMKSLVLCTSLIIAYLNPAIRDNL